MSSTENPTPNPTLSLNLPAEQVIHHDLESNEITYMLDQGEPIQSLDDAMEKLRDLAEQHGEATLVLTLKKSAEAEAVDDSEDDDSGDDDND